MSLTLGMVCNFFREKDALPGLIASAPDFFDECVFASSPPDGVRPDDESIALVEASGHKLVHDTVSKGFGVLRTRCISRSSCDWVMIMDADERMWTSPPMIDVRGTEFYPDSPAPSLEVRKGLPVDQRTLMRDLIAKADADDCMALCLSRRHWQDEPGNFLLPAQNWNIREDWQLRCVRNSPFVCYDPEHRMHEKLLDTRTWSEPRFLRASANTGPFIDHYSIFYKAMDANKNIEDAKTYESLEAGSVNGMWLSTFSGVRKQ